MSLSDSLALQKQIQEQQQLLETERGKASFLEMQRQEVISQNVKVRQQITQVKRLLRDHQAQLNRLNRRVSGFSPKELEQEPVKIKRLKKERDQLKQRVEKYREEIGQLTSQQKTCQEKIQEMEHQGIDMMMANQSHEVRLRSLQGSLVQAKLSQMRASKS